MTVWYINAVIPTNRNWKNVMPSETIFLDEPTTGLDPLSRLETWSAIKKAFREYNINHTLYGGGQGACIKNIHNG